MTSGSPSRGGHAHAWRLNHVPAFQKFREEWLRPALFFGNNPISLAGGAITTASGITMISYWLAELAGHLSDNPYLGIIFLLILPAIFLLGLALIPVGIFLRRRTLKKAGQIPAVFPSDRFQRSHLPPRHRHRAGGHHRQFPGRRHRQLSRRGVHGFPEVLRRILPRDEARIHGLSDLHALPCALRRVPHRLRRPCLLQRQGQRHQAAD